jgi:hypothetical protein
MRKVRFKHQEFKSRGRSFKTIHTRSYQEFTVMSTHFLLKRRNYLHKRVR